MRDQKYAGQHMAAVLGWYDANARELPWRTGPADRARGVMPDPYRVWLSEIMLQQTTVVVVAGYFARFTARWPNVAALAAANDADVMAEWAGLGYYARARNLLKCARLVAALPGGRFPASQPALLALPGIGPYTAAAISTIAHDQAATVVDGNIERVMARLFAVQTPLPAAKKQLWQLADDLSPKIRPGDYAQALMDLGATVCTPKSPRCTCCPISTQCRARAQDCAATLPKRSPKKPKPTRHGHAYLGQRSDGAWLLERRVGSGLLGGMLCWPCSEWRTLPALADTSDEAANKAPSSADWPVNADWQDTGAVIRHTFTHFHLVLNIVTADLPLGTNPARGFFVPHAEFDPFALPSLMRKAHAALRPVEPKAAGA